jgi:dTDP-4-amino-4,6-dideoxygalactose transaminase/acetyltransferase-like isoleucine patch superfamily enzyme
LVHPTATVEPGAQVGPGTSVWHHSHLRAGAVVGAGCTLGANVHVDAGARVGDRVKIQNNVSVYRGVELADEVFVGPSVVFTNDLRPRATSSDWQVRVTVVRRGASIGANATIVAGAELGEHCMVGAGAVVTSPVRPHQLVAGNPARHLGWVCACGQPVSRASAPPEQLRCGACLAGAPGPPGPAAAPGAPGAAQPRIPLAKVELGAAEEQAVLGVLRSGRLASGAQVAELERQVARLHGAASAVAVCNASVGLLAALRAHGVGPGDEVITSPLTFAATLGAIVEAGATARFADVTDDLTMDPASAASLVTSRTKALLPVHLYGLPAAMAEICELAARHGLAVLEDAAQAHGALVGDRPAGSFGTAVFSFYGTKNVTCGEGGVITCQDGGIAARLRLLRNHGLDGGGDHAVLGTNYRLTDIQAALAVAQLGRLPELNGRRAENAARLSAGLAGVPGLLLPVVPPGRRSSWHLYTVRVTAGARLGRDQLGKQLAAAGIEARPYYRRLVHEHPCYAQHPRVRRDPTPRAGRAAAEVLALPVHPAVTGAGVDRIVACVREALTG